MNSKQDKFKEIDPEIIVKWTKAIYKQRILKAASETQLITYMGSLIKLLANFSLETMEARRQWIIYLKC